MLLFELCLRLRVANRILVSSRFLDREAVFKLSLCCEVLLAIQLLIGVRVEHNIVGEEGHDSIDILHQLV